MQTICESQVKISPQILADKAASAITPRTFLKRMLNNLGNIYQADSNAEMCFRVQQYLRCGTYLASGRNMAYAKLSE